MGISLIRTIILYLLIVIAVRLMGKRQIGQMQPSELVVTILISDLIAVPMQDIGIPLFHGVIPVLTLVALEIIISVVSLKSVRARNVLCGKPVCIIEEGHVIEEQLKKTRMSVDDLMEELRCKDIFDPADVRYAQIETNGQLTAVLNTDAETVKGKMLGIKKNQNEAFYLIVSDGVLFEGGLRDAEHSMSWLETTLHEKGLDLRDVFILLADRKGKVFLQAKEKGG